MKARLVAFTSFVVIVAALPQLLEKPGPRIILKGRDANGLYAASVVCPGGRHKTARGFLTEIEAVKAAKELCPKD